MKITGNKIELKPTQESDREKIYTWLAQSDLTSSVIGHPNYPDHPIPSWKEFCDDYSFSFFKGKRGRFYLWKKKLNLKGIMLNSGENRSVENWHSGRLPYFQFSVHVNYN